VITPDAAWLPKALQGDDDAFAQLVETYQTPVFNMCYRMLGDEAEAEDAAQESFWRAYQALKRYDPNRSFMTWLLSIAAHYCIDQQRRRHYQSFSIDDFEEDFLPDNTPNPELSAARSETDRRLHGLLNQMQPQDRAAIILRYWYDLSDQEIGDALSLSVSAVKSRLHRARRLLAEQWETEQQKAIATERNRYGTHVI
jgi:RNA polymerase sigma-70 factor (ECF subfamily)